MDLEELKVIISAKTEGFEKSILKIKEQLSGLNKEVDKVSESISTKLNGNNSQKIQPQIDTDALTKQIDDLTSKVSAKAEEMAEKIQSQTKGIVDNIVSEMDKVMSGLMDRIKGIKLPEISFPTIGTTNPNTNDAANKTTTRGPPNDNLNIEALKAEIDSTAKALDIVNAKIDQQQAKLARLKEEYATTFNQANKNKLEEQILRTEGAINSLISKSDKLGFKLSDLDSKFAKVGVGAGEAAKKINSSGKFTGVFDKLAKSTAATSKKLSEAIKGLGSSCKGTNNHMSNMNNGLGNIARQFATWMIILPLIMKGLQAMTSGLIADLKTNEQFVNSLAQIKTNLMVAFTPIFYAILPAINSLMSALATATTYIASFISAIFGKTYQQSYQATQGLIDAKKAMGAYGDSAKKAAKDALGLAGFDEINNLSKNSGAEDNSKVPTLTQPNLNTSETDTKMQALADKLKKIFGEIFAPMKQAWDKEGKATMNALKGALDSVWQLAKDIGKTFLDVWGNSTGKKVCESILKLLQTIFNIIGDIAKAFKTAWDNGDLGKQIIQALFDALDKVLNLLKTIGELFRTVWNSGLGVEICTNILEILKNIFTIIGQIADSFRKAWESGLGKQITTDILNLLNGCLRVIKNITSSFSKAWKTNGDTICSAILLILDDIFGIISDITNKWANAWEQDGNGNALMDSLLSALGKILNTIGDIGQGIRESFGKAADTIFLSLIKFMKDVSDSVGDIVDGFKNIWDNGGKYLFDGIVQLIAQVADLILKISGPVFKDFANYFKEDLAPQIAFAAENMGFLSGYIAEFYDWVNKSPTAVNAFKDTLEQLVLNTIPGVQGAVAMSKIFKPISDDLDDIQQKMYKVWDDISKYLSDSWTNLRTSASTKWDEIKKSISDKWDELQRNSASTWDGIKKYISDKWVEINKDAPGLWDQIRTTLMTAWNNISIDSQGVWNGIVNFLNTTFSTNWGNAWTNLKNLVANAFYGLESIVKKPINAIIGMVNKLIDGLNSIEIDIPDSKIFGDYAGESFSMNLKHIPALATGGIIDSPTLAMVGEAGKEAVMPLENNTGWITDLATKIAGIMGVNDKSVSTSSGGDGDIVFLLDGEVLGKIAIKRLLKMKREGYDLSELF